MSQAQPFEEAIEALRRDPTHAVRVKVDAQLTVEVRAVTTEKVPRRTAAEAFRNLGVWERASGAELDSLFANVRQRSNRAVTDIP